MEEQQEIWKDIIIENNGVIYDYTGLYQISSLGRVKNVGNSKTKKEKILKCRKSNGYLYVALYTNGHAKQYSVHRLVAIAFVPNPYNLPEVNHRDECKTNNIFTNLEWCNHKYNINYSKDKMSEVHKGKQLSNKHKHSVGESLKGRTLADTHKNNISESLKGCKNPKARKIVCVETKQSFDTITEAERWCKCSSIKQHLSNPNRCKSAGKHPVTGERLHWMYYEDWMEQQKNEEIAN